MGMPVGIGGVLLCSGTLGGVALRIVLGDQAFASYFGNHVRDWAFHCPEFALASLMLTSDTSLLCINLVGVGFPRRYLY
jgi:hypothetical protein